MSRGKFSAMVLGAGLIGLLTGGLLLAAEYPTKPVTLFVGFPPGGPSDLSARALAEAVKPYFPKPITVVNKPGGGGVLSTAEMIKSAPDGYTLGHVDISQLSVAPHLEPNLPYKGPDSLEYILSCITAQNGFAVKADAPWKTMKEMIDYAKANPGKLRVGVSGVGSTTHLHFLSLKLLGVPMTEVPFVGAAPTITAILGGHVEGIVLNLTPIMPHVKAGKLKFLSLFTDERVTDVPEIKSVPTLKELGYKDVITEGTAYFIGAPKGTPKRILDTLYDAFLKAEKTDFYKKFCLDNVLAIELKGPAELKKDAERSYIYYRDFIERTGLKSMLRK